MRKALLAGALGVLVGAGVLATQGASAYNGTTCSGTQLVPPIGPTPPVTNPVDNSTIVPSLTTGAIYGPGGNEVVCADGYGPMTSTLTGGAATFDGGAVIAGLTTTNGPTRYCVANVPVSSVQNVPVIGPTNLIPVGVYVIADGDNANAEPPLNGSDGYIGVSNYESGTGNQNCAQGGGGGGTNSGGAFGTDFVSGVNLPLPIACGNTSGDDFGTTTRDGCYVP